MIKALGYAAQNATSPLTPFTFERRDPGPHDVQIEILYCGICHSDLHQARNHWDNSTLPDGARARNHRPCHQRRRAGDEI